MLIDTHCHIHTKQYSLDPKDELLAAQSAGVEKIILVGEDAADSILALDMAETDPNLYVAVGLHPHEAGKRSDLDRLVELAGRPKVVAIGECGLDYWYEHSSRSNQLAALEFQIELAISNKLPMSFHVRGSKTNPADAFDDFFAIFDSFKNRGDDISGVIHSFSSGQAQLEGVLSRSLHVGLNGIATFADSATQEVINTIPLHSIVLETDAPFLTPVPERGKVNTPKYLVFTAEYLSQQRGISFDELAQATTSNANRLFNLEV